MRKWCRRQLTRKLVTASAFLPSRSFSVRQCRAFLQVAMAVIQYLKWYPMESVLASSRPVWKTTTCEVVMELERAERSYRRRNCWTHMSRYNSTFIARAEAGRRLVHSRRTRECWSRNAGDGWLRGEHRASARTGWVPKTRFVGKIGDDLLGKTILESLRQYDAAFPETMVIAAGEATSYTIVLSPPHVDRGFLHCPGANDTFVAADLDVSSWQDARILHFGYPPLMRRIVADEGHGLAGKFAEVQASGALVSLDMAMCAEGTPERATNWKLWLRRVLPHVDLFLPSFDEIVLMLADESDVTLVANAARLANVADKLLGLDVPIVLIKLGDQGLYLRTSDDVTWTFESRGLARLRLAGMEKSRVAGSVLRCRSRWNNGGRGLYHRWLSHGDVAGPRS